MAFRPIWLFAKHYVCDFVMQRNEPLTSLYAVRRRPERLPGAASTSCRLLEFSACNGNIGREEFT
jgi:hypothetical protein